MSSTFLSRAFKYAGIATLLAGVSFARGATEEGEPRAAAMAVRAFGIAGAALISASWVLNRSSRKAT